MTAALKAVFYSEFDNVQGPKILYQAPENFLQPEEFDGVSDYVITGKQLCGKLVTVNAFGFKIMGYPLAIKNTKYDRNNLLFNVGFVFDEDADTDPYHAPLRKIGLTLYSMEKESQFLFNLESKERLGAVLTNILAGLNGHGEVAMVLDDANMLNLKLLRIPTTRGQVWEHEVPILLQGRGLLMSLDCDLALQQVIPHIDGIKYAKKISLDAEVDIDVVKRCLRFLLYCNCIAVVDIFQYSNMYISTEFTVEFARNPGLQKQCVKFVRREGHDPVWGTALARLYCSFRPGVCVTEVLVQNAGLAEGIDHRRLITFGVIYGIIRRIHTYPVCILQHSSPDVRQLGAHKRLSHGHNSAGIHGAFGGLSAQMAQLQPEIQRMMDGTRSSDELCSHFMMTFEEIEALAGSTCTVARVFK